MQDIVSVDISRLIEYASSKEILLVSFKNLPNQHVPHENNSNNQTEKHKILNHPSFILQSHPCFFFKLNFAIFIKNLKITYCSSNLGRY